MNLWAGALLCWLLLAFATAVWMPGATYLFLWPMVFATIGGFGHPWRTGVATWALAPGLMMMAPTIELFFQSLTMRMAFVGAFATALLLGLLIPCLMADRRRRTLETARRRSTRLCRAV